MRDGTIEGQRAWEHLAKSAAEERARVARDIVDRLEPIILGPEFLRELHRRRASAALENAPQLFDEEDLSTLNETLIARIRALGTGDPTALLSDQSSQSQLFAWWRFNQPESLHVWLDDILKHNPGLVVPVLRGIVDSPFSMEHKFREILSVASPSTICDGLYDVYGDALTGKTGGEADRYDLEIARSFLFEFRRQSQSSDVSPTPAPTTA